MDEKGEPSRMSVFAVLYRGRALTPKLERICAAFGAATHALPNFARPAEVAAALTDSKAVIKTTLAWLKNGAAMAAHTLGYLRLALTQWRMGIPYILLGEIVQGPLKRSVAWKTWPVFLL
jgi:hypothetical protein